VKDEKRKMSRGLGKTVLILTLMVGGFAVSPVEAQTRATPDRELQERWNKDERDELSVQNYKNLVLVSVDDKLTCLGSRRILYERKSNCGCVKRVSGQRNFSGQSTFLPMSRPSTCI
jgi:hypothetical protein